MGHKSISKEASQVYINSQITDYDNHNAPEPKIDPNTNNVIDTNDDQLENSGTVHANFGSSNTFIQDNNNNDESLKGKQDISPAPNNNIVFDIE